MDSEQTVSKLFHLKFEAIFNEPEEGYIYSLENDYDYARHGIYGRCRFLTMLVRRHFWWLAGSK